MMMGGRIAEEIVFGDITAGASSDIQRATDLARRMVVEWGMSEKLGFMSFGKNNEVFIGRDYQVQNQYSEATAKIIDEEIKRIIDSNYKKAKELLESKRDLLDSMSKLLLEEETIYAEEVDELIAGKDPTEIVARLHAREEQRRAKEDAIRREQELAKLEKMQELKIKAAEALKEAGIIGDAEIERIKDDYDKLVKEKEQLLNEKQELLKEEEGVEKPTETVEEKTEEPKAEKKTTAKKKVNTTTKKPVKKFTKDETKDTKAKKTTTKSRTTKKSTTETPKEKKDK